MESTEINREHNIIKPNRTIRELNDKKAIQNQTFFHFHMLTERTIEFETLEYAI